MFDLKTSRHPTRGLGAAFSLDALKQTASAAAGGQQVSTSTALQSAVPPDVLRKALRSSPAYTQNRDRAALGLEKALTAYDAYIRFRPYLFYGSLTTGAVSAYLIYKRAGKEAKALYLASLITSAGVAWFTRPGLVAPAQPPPPGSPPGTAGDMQILASLDQMVAARRAQDPTFADKVFRRIVQMPGVREQMQANPLVQAAVL